MPSDSVNTSTLSKKLRERVVDLTKHRLLIVNFHGSRQELDLTKPPNCNGYGRIRHFRLVSNPDWPSDPLPIEPACWALDLASHDELRAQVFQLAACNWHCWYCFVDSELLSANLEHAAFFTSRELLDLFLKEPDRPQVIDLSGGNPGLVPEWVLWMMRELRLQGLDDQIYLWSDDNLSNDYFWQHLALEDIEEICTYPNYGKVCCFKGFDEISFSFNTRETPGLFGQQFEIMRRLLCLDLDLYCYATFTTPVAETIADSMARFIDRLQELDPNLPLRTVPLEIRVYEPTRERLRGSTSEALANQYKAVAAWREELAMRYSTDDLNRPITEVSLRNRRRVAKKSRATGPRVS